MAWFSGSKLTGNEQTLVDAWISQSPRPVAFAEHLQHLAKLIRNPVRREVGLSRSRRPQIVYEETLETDEDRAVLGIKAHLANGTCITAVCTSFRGMPGAMMLSDEISGNSPLVIDSLRQFTVHVSNTPFEVEEGGVPRPILHYATQTGGQVTCLGTFSPMEIADYEWACGGGMPDEAKAFLQVYGLVTASDFRVYDTGPAVWWYPEGVFIPLMGFADMRFFAFLTLTHAGPSRLGIMDQVTAAVFYYDQDFRSLLSDLFRFQMAATIG